MKNNNITCVKRDYNNNGERTFEEIGKIMGISAKRVYQIYLVALLKARNRAVKLGYNFEDLIQLLINSSGGKVARLHR